MKRRFLSTLMALALALTLIPTAAMAADEEDVPDAAARLRIIYPNLMRLDYDNRRTRAGAAPVEEADTGKKPPLELFAEFYERQNNGPMSEEQLAFAEGLIEKIWEDEG